VAILRNASKSVRDGRIAVFCFHLLYATYAATAPCESWLPLDVVEVVDGAVVADRVGPTGVEAVVPGVGGRPDVGSTGDDDGRVTEKPPVDGSSTVGPELVQAASAAATSVNAAAPAHLHRIGHPHSTRRIRAV
jgi:hypothetical protein